MLVTTRGYVANLRFAIHWIQVEFDEDVLGTRFAASKFVKVGSSGVSITIYFLPFTPWLLFHSY